MTRLPSHDFYNKLDEIQQQKLLDYLSGFVTSNRLSRFREKLQWRTRYLTVVLENVFQSHNASAVLRSCDCFGVQDIHFLEDSNPYRINPDVALGSSKWLTIHRPGGNPANSRLHLLGLKEKGYRLVAATPHHDDYTPETLPLDRPVALLFGTELAGLSERTLGLADGYVRIPMVGFTESLNISVSAAILLYTFTGRLYREKLPWQLPETQKPALIIQWLLNTVAEPEILLHDYLMKNGLTSGIDAG